MRVKWLVLPMLAGAALAQNKVPGLQVWFADGTGLDISTQSTGAAAPLSTTGSENVPAGYDYHRLVYAKDTVLLGYDIEARRTGSGPVALRIKPLNKEQVAVGGLGKWIDIPSIAAVREFPPLQGGDAVQVDILYNPATGERIYDTLKVLKSRAPSRPAATPAGERFSFQEVAIAIDGKPLGGAQNSWMRCGAMMIHLPDRGKSYLALAPSPDFPFQPSGWVDHTVLRFHAGAELVEITGKNNMLQKADFGTFWVYYVPDSAATQQELTEKRRMYSPRHPEIVALEKRLTITDRALAFNCADNLEQLLPPK